MNDLEHFLLENNGYIIDAVFTRETLKRVVDPFLARVRDAQKALGRRMILFLAAPPGAGKSTLAKLLELRSNGLLQTVPMDGFHYPNAVLKRMIIRLPEGDVPGASVKGIPETYDVQKLKRALEEARAAETYAFPAYDRRTHDPVENAVTVTSPILLLEGNWLLQPSGGWESLRPLADLTVFLDVEAADLREGLIARKARGGLSRKEAEAWFEKIDAPNIRLVKERHTKPDILWKRTDIGQIEPTET